MLGALEALKAAGIPAAAIMEKLKPLAEAAREHVEQTTDATSAMMLAQLDASRSSWTSEDA